MAYVDNPALSANNGILVHRIMVDGVAINASPAEVKSIKVSLSINKHDQAVITTKLTRGQAQEFLDKIIMFTYGPLVKRTTFYGYVSVVNPSRKYQEDMIYDIICLGVTQPMQTGVSRFWSNTTAPAIAGQIVSEHNLGFISDGHGFEWPTMAQTYESDWEMTVSLAALCGFVVCVNNGVIRFIDAAKVIQTAAPIAHLVKGDQVLDTGRELLDFVPSEESPALRKNVKPSFGFFSPTGEPVTTAEDEDSTYRYNTSAVVLSQDMADVFLRSWERNTSYWVEKASARIKGNTQIATGDVVNISLSRSSVVYNDYDGLWLVSEVNHTLTYNSFQTDLKLVRDKYNKPVNTTYKDFYSNVTYGRPRLLIDDSMGDKKWKSSWGTPIIRTTSLDDYPTSSSSSTKPWVPVP